LAIRKWPVSCTMIKTPKIMTAERIEVIIISDCLTRV